MTLGVIVALVSIVAMVVLIYIGMHVGIVLAVLSFVSVWIMRGNFDLASNLLALSVADSIADYNFGVIPLFVFMGFVVSAANYGRDLFDVTNWMFRRIKGGLGVSTVAANAGFAAITGVSIASASVFTRIAVPEMLRFGYSPRLAVGIVAGSSVLGMLIPPSVLMILYGILTDVSIGKLFIAGIVPGIILAIAFAIGIIVAVHLRPGLISATAAEAQDELTLAGALVKIAPIVLMVGLVMGGIYGGYFTATEAAGVGAGLSLVMGVLMRRLSWASFWRLLVDTATVTSTICFLLIAASLYSRMLAFSGTPTFFANWIAGSGFGFYTVLLIFIVMLLILGAILDSTSIMLITVPIMFPILTSFGADAIWMGIVIIVAVEIGIITPPVGIAAFVVHDTLARKDISLSDVFIGVFPFVLIMTGVLALLVLFPQLSLMLL
jgi:C4-dicarboxylate transporter, DctM subunit